MPKFAPKKLQEFVKDIFQACQSPSEEAELVAHHLVDSSLMGIDSHGVMRVPQYVEMIRQGVIRPNSPMTVCNDGGASAVLDCNHNFGQVGAIRGTEMAIEKASRLGVGCTLVRNCNHTGRVGAYTQMAAEMGMVALATCNGPKSGHFVAPFGGLEGRLATNPISFAAPTKGDPILVDISTSTTSEGKVRLFHENHIPLPEGWIIDNQGRPSIDPSDFYGPPRGAILPLGGSVGYKGFFLGLIVEILSGTLAGISTAEEPFSPFGLFLLVISVDAFGGKEHFSDQSHELVEYIKSSPRVDDSAGVIIPGEREFQTARLQQQQGIKILPSTWEKIESIARELSVEIPRAMKEDGARTS